MTTSVVSFQARRVGVSERGHPRPHRRVAECAHEIERVLRARGVARVLEVCERQMRIVEEIGDESRRR